MNRTSISRCIMNYDTLTVKFRLQTFYKATTKGIIISLKGRGAAMRGKCYETSLTATATAERTRSGDLNTPTAHARTANCRRCRWKGRGRRGRGGEWEGPYIHAGYFAGSVSAASGCNETCGAAWQWTVISACLALSRIKCITLLITLNINTRMSKCQTISGNMEK